MKVVYNNRYPISQNSAPKRNLRTPCLAISTMPDLKSYSVVSLDCYGSLVDWEAGMVEALGPSPSTFLPSLDTCLIGRKPNVLGGEVEDLEDGIAPDFGGCCLTICVQ